MTKAKRNPAIITIGIILIVVGVIVFAVSCVQLYNVQHTQSRWAEGFMQDYQARTNAENSVPCYIFMVFSALMVIGGIIMLAIKPRSTININNNYPATVQTHVENQPQIKEINFCPNCGNRIEPNSIYCTKCGRKIK